MYPNLRAEMARRQMSGLAMSVALGIRPATWSGKCLGRVSFSLDEAVKVKEILRTDLPLEELFQKEE